MGKTRRVLVELKTRIVLSTSEDHTAEDIEFWLNESSHCASNEFAEIAKAVEGNNGQCGCWCTEFKYLGEAKEITEDDPEPNSAIELERWGDKV